GPYEKQYIHKSGRLVPVRLSGMSFERDGERFIWSSVEDVSERKHTEVALLESQKMLQLVLDSIPVRVFWKDTESRYLGCNKLFAADAGLQSPEQIVGKTDHELGWKEQAEIYRDDDRKVIQSGKPKLNYEEPQTSPDGGRLWLKTSKIPLTDLSQTVVGVMGTYEDITQRKKQEERILHQAHFDKLTGIPNRFLALDRLAQLIKEARRTGHKVAVLFLDLDDFKKVNDSLGHEVGDRLLVGAAKRLGGVLRDSDTIGRFGGDEFIVLAGGLEDAADARPLAESLLEQFRRTFRVDGRELILTASIGIAVYPEDGDKPAALLRNADTAMYHSKGEGRNNYYYFTEAMNRGVSRRLALEEQMHGALARGEFRLCYQPVVKIRNRTIAGAEALLRWNNPALGEVPPVEFIPIAEQTGLIVSIGQYVLTEALARTVQWQQRRIDGFTISVNLSPHQFRDPNLLTFIERGLKQAGVSGKSLQLEITEGALMSGHPQVFAALEKLHQLGVRVAMDDFGTGYSSLSYLRKFPFDILTIDRSFVGDISMDMANRELVNAAIAMGNGLGLEVVAEGVETEEQLEHLTRKGCDLAQGYLFGEPVSDVEFSNRLADQFARQGSPYETAS
ncbi:MAG: EAL domain-containing protein, partial [Pseudomonadota bacterium]